MQATDGCTLVIDTSYGSTVGVVGHEPIVETDSRTHVEKLQVNIARAMDAAGLGPADISCIVVGVGPAPFTGLRAGLVTAKALAFATGGSVRSCQQFTAERADERSTNSMNITYTQNGDYLIPNIVIRKTKPLGHYGRLRKAYLEMHRPILFNELVLSDKLFEHCAEIDETARNRMELIVRSLAEQNGVTEQLKAENQMEWVRQMNACKAQAEEIVKAELIYD